MCETQIEFPLFWRFKPAEYEEIAPPADMSYQWHRSFVVFVRIVELPHAEQVAALEPAKIRMTSGNVTRQLVNDTLPKWPFGAFGLYIGPLPSKERPSSC